MTPRAPGVAGAPARSPHIRPTAFRLTAFVLTVLLAGCAADPLVASYLADVGRERLRDVARGLGSDVRWPFGDAGHARASAGPILTVTLLREATARVDRLDCRGQRELVGRALDAWRHAAGFAPGRTATVLVHSWTGRMLMYAIDDTRGEAPERLHHCGPG